MQRKSVPLSIKSADDASGTFTGLASVFDNVDSDGDIVRRGAFAKSLDSGMPIPVIWAHKADDPRNYVGEVVSAVETNEGLEVTGQLDLGTEHGAAAYRNVKGRRVSGLSIGYLVRNAAKSAAGNELTDLELVEVSIVARGANPAALIASVKSAGSGTTEALRTKVARRRVAVRGETSMTTDDKAGEERFAKGRDEQLEYARVILDAATELQRDLSEEEAAAVEKHLAEADRFEKMATSWRRSAHIRAAFEARSPGETVLRAGESVRGPHPTAGGFGLPGVGTGTGAKVAPLAFPEDSLRAMHRAVLSKSSLSIKGFSTVEGLLPARLSPTVLGPLHEGRLLDVLPAQPITAPSWEYIRHTSTTGAPGIVAEGQTKPEVTFVTDRVIAAVVKLAAHTAVSHESMQDFDAFTGYVQSELTRQVIDKENDELLNGSGTGGSLTGLLTTSGILSHAVTSETDLDAIEASIAALRVGAALATANLLVLHPSTWSSIRRAKDSQGRYLTTADPTLGEADTVWGIKVLTTTVIAAGTGLLLDTTNFGRVLVRETITMTVGTSGDDLVRNLARMVVEERIGLAVERPAALLAITGL
jgi:HK97 family phage major capsid protein/HK97 family phage prohead protease